MCRNVLLVRPKEPTDPADLGLYFDFINSSLQQTRYGRAVDQGSPADGEDDASELPPVPVSPAFILPRPILKKLATNSTLLVRS